MTHTQKRGLCWLIAAVMTAALMLFVLLFTDVTFATNDDSSIMRAFMGYETGEPVYFHLFIHGLLAWPLGWLGKLFPSLPWFTYLQLGMLALSCVVIAKSIMQSFLKHRRSLAAGALMAAVFLMTLCMKYITFLTFTQTAALLGAAAVAQMLSIEHDRGGKRVIVGMAGALSLVCLSYALRQDALLPLLGFCGLSYVLLCWEHYGLGRHAKRSLRPMIASLVMIAVVLSGMVGFRQAELSKPENSEYQRWQKSTSEVMDYTALRTLPQEAFDRVGWDETVLGMVERWCFLDPVVSTDDFETLAEYIPGPETNSFSERLETARQLFVKTAQESVLDLRCLGVGLAAALICLLGACAKRSPRLCLFAAGAMALAAAMIFYLAFTGRVPLRAILIAALPCAAVCFMLLPACLPSKGRLVPVVCYGLIVCLCVWCLMDVVPEVLIDEEEALNSGNPLTDLEEYAVYEPESLFLYDMSLVIPDTRAFPPYPDGIPNNVSFWGGWPLRSPQSIEQFANFGIDLMNLDPRDLLRDNVYFATAYIDPPPVAILDWLRAKVNPNIDYEIYSEYGYVYIFHFYEY